MFRGYPRHKKEIEMKLFPKLLFTTLLSSISVMALADVFGQIDVKLTVYSACAVNGTKFDSGESIRIGTLDFGRMAAVSKSEILVNVALESSQNLNITCDVDTPVNVSINAGQHSLGSSGERYLKNTTADTIHYTIYRDAASNIEYKANTSQSFLVTSAAPISIPLTGKVFANTGAAKARGDYKDTLTVTFSF